MQFDKLELVAELPVEELKDGPGTVLSGPVLDVSYALCCPYHRAEFISKLYQLNEADRTAWMDNQPVCDLILIASSIRDDAGCVINSLAYTFVFNVANEATEFDSNVYERALAVTGDSEEKQNALLNECNERDKTYWTPLIEKRQAEVTTA